MDFEAVLFDLDGTLLDRSRAADSMFLAVVGECYSGVSTEGMLHSFRKYDNNGYSNKVEVLNSLFDEYPPDYRIPSPEIYDFWNARFIDFFSLEEGVLDTIRLIVSGVKTAIITNGYTKTQNAKIAKAGLDKIFDTVIISEEAGVKKPDPQIFNLALQKLGVSPQEALYVGDNLVNDVDGCQKAGMYGVWYNPEKLKNETDIVPFKEITDFSQILQMIG